MNILRALSALLAFLSLLFVVITVAFLAITVLYPGMVGIGVSNGLSLVFVAGLLIASTALSFLLSALAQNLMIAAYSDDKRIQAIRLIIIFFVSPFLVWALTIPYAIVVVFSFIYGALVAVLAGALSMVISIDTKMLSTWVSFFILGEALYAAFKYNLFDWFVSTKQTSSLNIAESQYDVVFAKLNGKNEKLVADFVKSAIRITAINLIAVLFWASYMISGVATIEFTIENVPVILLAFVLGMIPLVLVGRWVGRQQARYETGGGKPQK
ncbi:hypothetical protein H0O02_00025 [Candidatus Micrarchaeota archaeon]|nr:hypothetical protein [Candidatus Micrarchaeota archaeon]